MSETVALTNTLSALGGIAAFFGGVIFLADRYTSRALAGFVERWGMHAAGVLALGAIALTLVYSDVFGFIPCGLCWFARIALYPQAVIAAVAVAYRDMRAARHGLALSVIGLVIALYSHYLQMGGGALINCPASGGDCGQRVLFEFGFVTLPLVAAALFFLLIALYLYVLSVQSAASALATASSPEVVG